MVFQAGVVFGGLVWSAILAWTGPFPTLFGIASLFLFSLLCNGMGRKGETRRMVLCQLSKAVVAGRKIVQRPAKLFPSKSSGESGVRSLIETKPDALMNSRRFNRNRAERGSLGAEKRTLRIRLKARAAFE